MTLKEKTKSLLPYGRQSIDETDIAAVVEALKSDYLTTGPMVQAFENALAKKVNVAFAVVLNSGTAALHVAMQALHIGAGDYVIVPAMTFLATANAARWCGAEVLFSDVNPDNGLMEPKHLLAVLENNKDKKIKAVVSVHLAGQTENLTELRAIANQAGLFLIEDACHAIGTLYDDGIACYPIGGCQHSDISVFSFHPVKTIAMGEGGAITTQNETWYRRILQLRSHGMNHDRNHFLHLDRATSDQGLENRWYYEMLELGLNYRQSDIHCALGLSQLKKLDQFVEKRRQLTHCYEQESQDLLPFLRPIQRTRYCIPAWHLYSVLIEFKKLGIERATLMQALREKQIGTQVHYIPVNEQPYYQNRYGNTVLPGAKHYYERTLSLPLYPTMTAEEV